MASRGAPSAGADAPTLRKRLQQWKKEREELKKKGEAFENSSASRTASSMAPPSRRPGRQGAVTPSSARRRTPAGTPTRTPSRSTHSTPRGARTSTRPSSSPSSRATAPHSARQARGSAAPASQRTPRSTAASRGTGAHQRPTSRTPSSSRAAAQPSSAARSARRPTSATPPRVKRSPASAARSARREGPSALTARGGHAVSGEPPAAPGSHAGPSAEARSAFLTGGPGADATLAERQREHDLWETHLLLWRYCTARGTEAHSAQRTRALEQVGALFGTVQHRRQAVAALRRQVMQRKVAAALTAVLERAGTALDECASACAAAEPKVEALEQALARVSHWLELDAVRADAPSVLSALDRVSEALGQLLRVWGEEERGRFAALARHADAGMRQHLDNTQALRACRGLARDYQEAAEQEAVEAIIR